MSVNILRDKKLLIAEHRTTVAFPIQYALVKKDGFSISVYHERLNFRSSERSPSSDMPFAVWKPDGNGLQSLTHEPFYSLKCAGLIDEMNEFCQQAYEAWKEGQEC